MALRVRKETKAWMVLPELLVQMVRPEQKETKAQTVPLVLLV